MEPRNREAGAGSREKEWPILPTVPEPIKTSPQYHFEDAARATIRPEPEPPVPEKLKGTAAHIWTAWHQSDTAKAFAAAINEQGIDLAVVTKQEAARSHYGEVYVLNPFGIHLDYMKGLKQACYNPISLWCK